MFHSTLLCSFFKVDSALIIFNHSYLSYYSLILFLSMAISAIVTAVFNFGAIGASRSINRELVESILGSTLRFVTIVS